MEDKIKRKIEKLLRLAGSDNPHEAERARHQAEVLMRKHNLSEGEIQVVTLECVTLNYYRPKTSDACLLDAVRRVAGVQFFYSSRRNQSGKLTTTVMVMGEQAHAEMTQYTLEVLYRQLDEYTKGMKQKYPKLKAGHIEDLRMGWVQSASRKLVNVFGTRDVPENVVDSHKKKMAGVGTLKSTKKEYDDDLIAVGFQVGKKASLYAGAGDNRNKVQRLSHAG